VAGASRHDRLHKPVGECLEAAGIVVRLYVAGHDGDPQLVAQLGERPLE
jgi:hypothetical protein